MFSRITQSLLSTGLMLICALPLTAQLVYIENTNNQMGLLNPTTGAYTPIGITSVRIEGFAEVGNTLYGLAIDDNLYRINPTTAALTSVGSIGVPLGIGAGFGETSDSTLYANLQLNKLYTIDPTTASATFVGKMGFDTDTDLSGDASGNLYDAQGLEGDGFYKIDRTTGAGTLLGTNAWGTVLAITYVQGVMYAINSTGSIYSVNLTTGAATFVSNYDVNQVGSVYAAGVSVTPAAPNVPEPGALALLLAGGLTGTGLFLRRRRKQPQTQTISRGTGV